LPGRQDYRKALLFSRQRKVPAVNKTDHVDAWSLADALRVDGQRRSSGGRVAVTLPRRGTIGMCFKGFYETPMNGAGFGEKPPPGTSRSEGSSDASHFLRIVSVVFSAPHSLKVVQQSAFLP
jgi:hypothetical protein